MGERKIFKHWQPMKSWMSPRVKGVAGVRWAVGGVFAGMQEEEECDTDHVGSGCMVRGFGKGSGCKNVMQERGV
jgi:hypothetical protein